MMTNLTYRIVGEFPNGAVVAGHANENMTLFSIYRSNDNIDVYEIVNPMRSSLYRVAIGKYLRTEYRP